MKLTSIFHRVKWRVLTLQSSYYSVRAIQSVGECTWRSFCPDLSRELQSTPSYSIRLVPWAFWPSFDRLLRIFSNLLIHFSDPEVHASRHPWARFTHQMFRKNQNHLSEVSLELEQHFLIMTIFGHLLFHFDSSELYHISIQFWTEERPRKLQDQIIDCLKYLSVYHRQAVLNGGTRFVYEHGGKALLCSWFLCPNMVPDILSPLPAV